MSVEDYLSFVMTKDFDSDWHALGFADEELSDLQTLIASDPEAGDVISGAGGLRKIRFARAGGGKSVGVRVCYANIGNYGVVLLATVFSKNEKGNLNATEKKY